MSQKPKLTKHELYSIKRLNVPFRFVFSEIHGLDDIDDTEAQFDANLLTNGFYYLRHSRFAFVKFKNKIYILNAKEWLSDFEFIDHQPLRDIEYDTLKQMVNLKIANKENLKLFFREDFCRDRKYMIKNIKLLKLKELKKPYKKGQNESRKNK